MIDICNYCTSVYTSVITINTIEIGYFPVKLYLSISTDNCSGNKNILLTYIIRALLTGSLFVSAKSLNTSINLLRYFRNHSSKNPEKDFGYCSHSCSKHLAFQSRIKYLPIWSPMRASSLYISALLFTQVKINVVSHTISVLGIDREYIEKH